MLSYIHVYMRRRWRSWRQLKGERPMRIRCSRSTAALLAFVFLLAYLAAPHAAAGPSSQVELKWLEWWVNEWGPPNHAKLIADFERANPAIKVTVVDTPYPQMAGKLNAAAAASENYDVFGVEGGWLSGLNKLGYVENLDPWLAKDKAFAGTLTGTA